MIIINKQVREANILIVDDDPINIRALVRCLPKDYQNESALSGHDALKLLDEATTLPDLILLDMMMPGMSGVDVCRVLKSNKRYVDIPVIFLSGALDLDNKVHALSSGAVDYITKPFNVSEVLARIDIHLQHVCLKRQFEEANKNLELLVEEKAGEILALQMETIFAITHLVDSREDSTAGHLDIVQNISHMLAKKLIEYPEFENLINNSYINQIYNTSLLYDIGKVGVPDSILLKPGALTTEESEIMKKHTRIGAETLMEVQKKHPENQFINMGVDITLSHHEKWDGTGYPNSLKGNEIPLAAQIISIAEQYDALLTDRVYKKASSFEEARQIISDCSGTFFNPRLVEAFLSIENGLREMFS